MKREYSDYINYVIGESKHLSFNHESNAFEIENYQLSWLDFCSLSSSLKRMRYNIPPKGLFHTELREIELGFYDKYLEDYCTDRLERNVSIGSTNLISKGDKVHVIGRNPSSTSFSDDEKKIYLKSLKNSSDPIHKTLYRLNERNKFLLSNLYITDEDWILCFLSDPVIFSSGLRRGIDHLKLQIKKLTGYVSEDRILGVIKNIRKKGWDDNLTWRPHIESNEIQGSIIGISSKSSSYSLLTGRHRVTAAVYLYKKGELDGEIVLDYPRIIYPWKTWVYDNI